MLKFLIAPLGAFAFLIAGCSSTDMTAIIGAAQAAAQAACGFLPTAEVVAAIVTSGSVSATNSVAEGTAIGNAICKAQTASHAMPGKSATVTVDGVAVKGWYVK